MIRSALVAVVLALACASVCAPRASAQSSPAAGPGGPILVVTGGGAKYGGYYAEILRAEGMNEFAVADTGALNPATLGAYQVVVLAATGLNGAAISALTGWVAAGGNLIAMKPDASLASLIGLTPSADSLAEGYIKVETGSGPGAGITGATMQFHGTADRWSPAGATSVATLFSDANSPTANPAVSLRSVGSAGGQAAAFTYDLARSVVETRQGNPAWAGQERDGQTESDGHTVIRSDDLFFPDWVNLDKVQIPQADEQQRLLANLITQMNLDRTPLPRFWYLPRGGKAAVVMTGDDHASGGGTAGQFDRFMAESPPGCSVSEWTCIRATSYVYPGTPITDEQAQAYQSSGFEIALHLSTDDCHNYTPASIEANWLAQLQDFQSGWPSLGAPRTNRTHCIVWSDWAGTPRSELQHGVRLDTNYYYWPASWVLDRPGMFTGSGMPMRFADDLDGSLIDVYQAATQMPDEAGLDIPVHIAALLDGALGADGYYGVFTANMHTDFPDHAGANAIVAAAKERGVPVVSAVQMLDWLDGRNGSSFQGVSFSGAQLRFHVAPAAGANGLEAMLPVSAATGALSGLTRNGAAVGPTPRRLKGVDYAAFDAAAGDYVATYGAPPGAPTLAGAKPSGGGGPRITVSKRKVRVSRNGVVRLRVKCPRSAGRCRLDIRLRRAGRDIARKKLTVAGGKTVSVKLRLKRSARVRLLKQRSLRVKVVIKATDARGKHATTSRPLKLLAPR